MFWRRKKLTPEELRTPTPLEIFERRFLLWDEELRWCQNRKNHRGLIVEVSTPPHALRAMLRIIKMLDYVGPKFSYICGGIPATYLADPDEILVELPGPSTALPVPYKDIYGIRAVGTDITPERARLGYDVIFWFDKVEKPDAKISAVGTHGPQTFFQVVNPLGIKNIWKNVWQAPEEPSYPVFDVFKDRAKLIRDHLGILHLKNLAPLPSQLYDQPPSEDILNEGLEFDPTISERRLMEAMEPENELDSKMFLAFVREWLPTQSVQEAALTLIIDAGNFDDKLGVIETARALS